MTDAYRKFLDSKRISIEDAGITINPRILNKNLFPFQRDIAKWALRKGRAAIFCDCGLGKTIMQLEFAHQVPGKVLILAPLAVAQQTVREGEKFGIKATYSRRPIDEKVTITNYEMLEHFHPSDYQGIVLDESSILKSFDGTFRNLIIDSFRTTPFRLACTATPAPNDYMELGNHSEFLGSLTRTEMLSTFFVHDGGDTAKWRVKRHAQKEFWRWVCTWAVMMRKPSDLGYSDDGFILPELSIHDLTVEQDKPDDGRLFAMPAATLQERRQARSGSTQDRTAEVARIVATRPDEPWLVWCNLNVESREAKKLIPNSVEVCGADSRESKEDMVQWFIGAKCICGLAKTENISGLTEDAQLKSGIADAESFTPMIQKDAKGTLPKRPNGERQTQKHSSLTDCDTSELLQNNIETSSKNRMEAAPFAGAENQEIQGINDSMLTIATNQESSGDYYVPAATLGSANSKIMPHSSKARQCTCGYKSGKRILITKPSIFGWGLNFQHCPNVVFLGLSDSYEEFYQALRRVWRFGQNKEVNCYIVTSSNEGAVTANIKRKESDALAMAKEMVQNMHEINETEIKDKPNKKKDQPWRSESVHGWTMHRGDCVEIVKQIPDNSIHYSIFSPPFASLYTYSDSMRDMGNCRTHSEFYEHFAFLAEDLYRVTMPGRNLSFHCMNLPISKERDGFIGIADFRGDLIRIFQKAGFIYHSEVCIWKDPVRAMQRTKALGLLHKQIKKDSCMSRQGIADYLVTMRKHGENPERVSHTADEFPVAQWQELASPVWMDIDPSDTLQRLSAREHDDERHICPLQLEVIRRGLKLWSNPGDTVLSPFAGIGSEGYVAVGQGRKFIGIELKESYYLQSLANLKSAKSNSRTLFDIDDQPKIVEATA